MRIPWDAFFVIFAGLAAALFVAAGVGALTGKRAKASTSIAVAALGAMLLGLVSGAIYLGHPERVFGAFANIHSVLSRQLIAVFVFTLLMVAFLYKQYRGETVARTFSLSAVLMALIVLGLTVQLIRV